MKHRDITVGDVHVAHAFEYADATARLAANSFDAKDVKKLALQLDDYSYWTLTSISPVTWVRSVGSQGQQGVPGSNGTNGTNGQGFSWKGAWVSGTVYNPYDVVSYNGSSYNCIAAVSGTTTPDTDATHWGLVAKKGDTGAAGSGGLGSSSLNTVRAYCNKAFTPPASASSIVPIDTSSFDTTGGSLDLVNHAIKPNKAGYYLVTGQVQFAGSPAEFFSLGIYKNGVGVTDGTISPNTGSASAMVTDIVYCNGTTDYLQLSMWVTSAGPLQIGSAGNFMSAVLLSGDASSGSGGSSNNAARAYRSAALAVAAAAWTKIPLDSVDYDPNAVVDISNGRITPKVAGYYNVTGGICVQGGTNARALIYKNGTLHTVGSEASTTYAYASVADVIYMNGTTDYVELWTYADAANTIFNTASPVSATNFLAVALSSGSSSSSAILARGHVTTSISIPAQTMTKIPVDTKDFDTGTNTYDSVNKRFQPTVAGYYTVTGIAAFSTSSGAQVLLVKNGDTNNASWGTRISDSSNFPACTVSDIMYFNGTTDYVELWAYTISASSLFLNGTNALSIASH